MHLLWLVGLLCETPGSVLTLWLVSVFVQNTKYICKNCQMYIFVQLSKKYLSELQNIFSMTRSRLLCETFRQRLHSAPGQLLEVKWQFWGVVKQTGFSHNSSWFTLSFQFKTCWNTHYWELIGVTIAGIFCAEYIWSKIHEKKGPRLSFSAYFEQINVDNLRITVYWTSKSSPLKSSYHPEGKFFNLVSEKLQLHLSGLNLFSQKLFKGWFQPDFRFLSFCTSLTVYAQNRVTQQLAPGHLKNYLISQDYCKVIVAVGWFWACNACCNSCLVGSGARLQAALLAPTQASLPL